MVNQLSAAYGARGGVEDELDRLLAAVESFGAEPDRAALRQRIGDAIRDLLGCDHAGLIDEAGGDDALAGPLRVALLSHARAAGRPTSVSAREVLEGAHDALPAATWAVAPLPSGAAHPRAVVAAWITRREPTTSELRTLGVVARWAAAAIELRDRRAVVDASLHASEDFVTAAAHELRTPLTPLRLTVDRAARALGTLGDVDRAKGALAGVDEHVRRMTRLVDTLLEASRIARGDLVLVRRDTDLAAVVSEVLERHAEAARHGRCDISMDAPERIVGRWDGQRLREAIEQLVCNAIKFGGGSPVRVELSRHAGAARVLVLDRGSGIALADQERIFGRFERAVSVRNYGGLGVGLWIAREIARAHGGDVTVESAPGEGSAFSLRIPIHRHAAGR